MLSLGFVWECGFIHTHLQYYYLLLQVWLLPIMSLVLSEMKTIVEENMSLLLFCYVSSLDRIASLLCVSHCFVSAKDVPLGPLEMILHFTKDKWITCLCHQTSKQALNQPPRP